MDYETQLSALMWNTISSFLWNAGLSIDIEFSSYISDFFSVKYEDIDEMLPRKVTEANPIQNSKHELRRPGRLKHAEKQQAETRDNEDLEKTKAKTIEQYTIHPLQPCKYIVS